MRVPRQDLESKSMSFFRYMYIDVTVLFMGTVMFFSCKTDPREIDRIASRADIPDMSGEKMELVYSDSARVKYRVTTPLYNKFNQNDKKYDEFPKGLKAILYDKAGKEVGSLVCKYAKKLKDESLWEIRDEVVVINAEGKKLETELLYWDMKKELVYSDRYTRLTVGEQIIEGNKGFESDQQLHNPVFKQITGEVEIQE